MKKVAATLIFLIIGVLFYFKNRVFVAGGGGSELIAPDTIKTGEPTDIQLIVTATGGGPLKGRYTNISFGYKLDSEKTYHVLQPHPIPLPDNFKAVQSKSSQSEAYEFTIPPYPKGTVGEIEYYDEMIFDGYPQNRNKGNKKITVSDDAKSSFDLKHNLSVLNVCNKNFKINIVNLEGIHVTERIARLMDEEFRNSKAKDDTTACYFLNQLPEYSQLNSEIKDYDYQNAKYLVMLQLPFVIDLKANVIYKVNADQSLGKVLGPLQVEGKINSSFESHLFSKEPKR